MKTEILETEESKYIYKNKLGLEASNDSKENRAEFSHFIDGNPPRVEFLDYAKTLLKVSQS